MPQSTCGRFYRQAAVQGGLRSANNFHPLGGIEINDIASVSRWTAREGAGKILSLHAVDLNPHAIFADTTNDVVRAATTCRRIAERYTWLVLYQLPCRDDALAFQFCS